jgi:hypothetical protein
MFKKTPTLDSILSSFRKTLTDLEDLIHDREIKIKENDDRIAQIEIETSDLAAEVTKATQTASNLRALIGE